MNCKIYKLKYLMVLALCLIATGAMAQSGNAAAISGLNIVGHTDYAIEQSPVSATSSTNYELTLSDVAAALGVSQQQLSENFADMLYATQMTTKGRLMADTLTNVFTTDSTGWWFVKTNSQTADTVNIWSSAKRGTRTYLYAQNFKIDDAGTLTFSLGQRVNTMHDGDKANIPLYIVAGDKAWQLNLVVSIVKPSGNVGGEDISVQFAPGVNNNKSVALDDDKIAALLGTTTGNMRLYAIDANGERVTTGTANNGGFWLDKKGNAGDYSSVHGEGFYVEPVSDGNFSSINIGTYGASITNQPAGTVMKTTLYIYPDGNPDTYYQLHITATVDAGSDNIAEKYTTVMEINGSFRMIPDAGYVWSSEDNAEATSWKTPWAPIKEALGLSDSEQPTFYGVNAIDTVKVDGVVKEPLELHHILTDATTMGGEGGNWINGFWMNSAGNPRSWGGTEGDDNSLTTWGNEWSITDDADYFQMKFMMFPGRAEVGDVRTGTFYLANTDNNRVVAINITLQYVNRIVDEKIVGHYSTQFPADASDFTIDDISFNDIADSLGISAEELANGNYLSAMNANGMWCVPQNCLSGVGIDADGYYTESVEPLFYVVVADTGEGYSLLVYSDQYESLGNFNKPVKLCFEVSDDSSAYARRVIIDCEAVTTGINGVKSQTTRNDDSIYDLSGRKVTSPRRGVYIIRGKKVLRK